jgi:ABC-type transport system involved in Fe-S cluster assembly fused permease/ATPase subunit
MRRDVPVLTKIDLDVPVNATVAFVGTSGAGKSTILNLIQRFYDVSSGEVRIDGVDVKSYPHKLLHKNIAWVQQEPVLFGVSIAENISYGYSAGVGSDKEKPTMESDLIQIQNDGSLSVHNDRRCLRMHPNLTMTFGCSCMICSYYRLIFLDDPRILN